MNTNELHTPPATHAGADRLVRLPEVRFLTGLGKSSIYEGVKAGTFPQAVRVTDYAVAWRKSEIDGWIASRPLATEPPAEFKTPIKTPTPRCAPAPAAKKTPGRTHRAARPAAKRSATTTRKARA